MIEYVKRCVSVQQSEISVLKETLRSLYSEPVHHYKYSPGMPYEGDFLVIGDLRLPRRTCAEVESGVFVKKDNNRSWLRKKLLSSEDQSGFSDWTSVSSQEAAKPPRHKELYRRGRNNIIHRRCYDESKETWDARRETQTQIHIWKLKSFTCYPSTHGEMTALTFLAEFERETGLVEINNDRFF